MFGYRWNQGPHSGLLHFFPTAFLTMFPAEDPTCSRPFHDILHIPCHRERHEISATELVVTFVLHSHRAVQTSETIFQCFPLGKRLRNQPAMDGMVPNRTTRFIRTACILAWHIVRRNRHDLEHDTHKHAATVWAGHLVAPQWRYLQPYYLWLVQGPVPGQQCFTLFCVFFHLTGMSPPMALKLA